ncbi:MAG: endonuclease [Aquimarina sp.]|nr:endonuclease [Aquimarina sp.]
MSGSLFTTHKNTDIYTIAFYNLENLFDTKDDPHTLDNDFLPHSDKKWNHHRYEKKLKKLGKAISKIGYKETGRLPVIIGVAETENEQVLKDLANTKHLIKHNYAVIHYESPDERGIDVGLLYDERYFKVNYSESIPLYVENELGVRDYTRDILLVRGLLNNEEIYLLVNHWPSRREGAEITEPKRIVAAQKNREIIDQILQDNPEAKILIMGDFNDDPTSNSIHHLVQQDFYNPMENLLTIYDGSLSHRGRWNLFDQIILSNNFHRFSRGSHNFMKADIFDHPDLKVYHGRYKGLPFRTYAGDDYKGGVSDHFPVYVLLKYNLG